MGFHNMAIAFVAPIQESLPHVWFHKSPFISKYTILFDWLLMATVLGMAYECNLLSILTVKT